MLLIQTEIYEANLISVLGFFPETNNIYHIESIYVLVIYNFKKLQYVLEIKIKNTNIKNAIFGQIKQEKSQI